MSDLPGFHVFPLKEAFRRVPRSAGVALIIAISIGVVALDGLAPAVGRALEARTDALADGQYWRLFTYVFPHNGGWLHVCLNMALLGLYGWQSERIVGTVRFLVVYLMGGAVAMALLFSFRTIDAASGLTGGASLAVFAVVAATGLLYAAEGPTYRKEVVRVAATVCALLVVAGVVSMARRRGAGGALSDAPALEGVVFGLVNHALGVIAGVLLGACLLRRRSAQTQRAVAIALTVLVTVGALAVGTSRASSDPRQAAGQQT